MSRGIWIGVCLVAWAQTLVLFAQAPTLTPTPTATGAPVVTPTPTLPDQTQTAILIGETALPVGGMKSTDVFVKNVSPDVQRIEIHLAFDPSIVQVVDADQNPANGVQIDAASLPGYAQAGGENRVDNEQGRIVLILVCTEPPGSTAEWLKAATITWRAQKIGASTIDIVDTTRFLSDKQPATLVYVAHSGVVSVRAPGVIKGAVYLQGRTQHREIAVSGILVTAHIDKTYTLADGHFELVASHGEGFYTLTAFAPGYLAAESDRPIQVTMDSITEIGRVVLLGGDVNGDNQIDVRDLAYIAWHFDRVDNDPAADINGDGRVDISDLTLTAGNFGQTGPTTWPVTVKNE